MQKLIFFLIFPFTAFCQTPQIDSLKQIVFKYPVSELNTEELKEQFISSTGELSTAVARFYDKQYQKFAFEDDKSPIDESFKIWIKTDSLLFYQIKTYFDLYGFPEKSSKAKYLLSIFRKGYTSEMIQIKREFFPVIYQEFQNGLLSTESLWWYLYVLGEQTLGNKFEINENLSNYEQVEDMMIQLHITPY